MADFFGRGARGTAALPQNFGVKKLARTEKNSAYSPGFFITHATPVRKKYRVRGATCLGVDRATSGVFRVVENSLAIRRRRGGAPSAFRHKEITRTKRNSAYRRGLQTQSPTLRLSRCQKKLQSFIGHERKWKRVWAIKNLPPPQAQCQAT